MSRLINLIGQKFGKLTVIKHCDFKGNRNENYWQCRCDCGNIKDFMGVNLRHGLSKSCGCTNLQRILIYNDSCRTHGMSKQKIYKRWDAMISRCYRETSINYKYYGARGIKVCERWHKFENFLEDMGMPKVGMSIDRIDNDSDYCLKNCRWATGKEQANNKSRTIMITYNGFSKSISEWSKELNISRTAIYNRVKNKWSIEEIFTIPIKKS